MITSTELQLYLHSYDTTSGTDDVMFGSNNITYSGADIKIL